MLLILAYRRPCRCANIPIAKMGACTPAARPSPPPPRSCNCTGAPAGQVCGTNLVTYDTEWAAALGVRAACLACALPLPTAGPRSCSALWRQSAAAADARLCPPTWAAGARRLAASRVSCTAAPARWRCASRALLLLLPLLCYAAAGTGARPGCMPELVRRGPQHAFLPRPLCRRLSPAWPPT
jgi:hypothetical protein